MFHDTRRTKENREERGRRWWWLGSSYLYTTRHVEERASNRQLGKRRGSAFWTFMLSQTPTSLLAP